MNGASDRLMNETVRAVGRFVLDALVTAVSHDATASRPGPLSARQRFGMKKGRANFDRRTS
jgi:hypothetical protein